MRRIGLARDAMKRLDIIWKAKNNRARTKVRVYESLVPSILPYIQRRNVDSGSGPEQKIKCFRDELCQEHIRSHQTGQGQENQIVKKSLTLNSDVTQKITVKRLRYFGHV